MNNRDVFLGRLSLPDPTFMGYWNVCQVGNAQQRPFCPTETHPIAVKVCKVS